MPGLANTGSTPINVSPIPIAVEFSEDMPGLDATDLTLSNATATNFAGSGSSYTFDLVPSSDGAVSAVINTAAAQDAAGNAVAGTPDSFSRTYDGTRPELSLASSAGSASNVTPIPVTASFTEPVTGFDESDVALSNATPQRFRRLGRRVHLQPGAERRGDGNGVGQRIGRRRRGGQRQLCLGFPRV